MRLERVIGKTQVIKNINFNSIKVRLERSAASAKLLQLLFQFHKGAIRTLRFSNLPLDYFKFQFHKGAIRTYSS